MQVYSTNLMHYTLLGVLLTYLIKYTKWCPWSSRRVF